jgi:hypothetical protein
MCSDNEKLVRITVQLVPGQVGEADTLHVRRVLDKILPESILDDPVARMLPVHRLASVNGGLDFLNRHGATPLAFDRGNRAVIGAAGKGKRYYFTVR